MNRAGEDRGGEQQPNLRLPVVFVSLQEEQGLTRAEIDQVLDVFDKGIEGGRNASLVTASFEERLGSLERRYVDSMAERLLDSARATVATRLIALGEDEEAVGLIARTNTPAGLFRILTSFGDVASRMGLGMSSAELEQRVLEHLDHTAPQRALDLLRHVRRQTFMSKGEYFDPRLLDYANQRLAERIGADFDPINDWAASEAEIMPLADWAVIAELIRNDDLWPEDYTMHKRMFFAGEIATGVQMLLEGDFRPTITKAVGRDYLPKRMKQQSESLAISYLNSMVCVAYFRRGFLPNARAVVNAIPHPEVVVHVADTILRQDNPMTDEAQRIAQRVTNAEAFINFMLLESWPDRTWPNARLDEVLIVRERKGKGPVHSVYPIQFRVDCMNALAAQREAEGDPSTGAELRRRAKQLDRQGKTGYVKYSPRKNA